jgi:hypothetical protein
MTMTIEGIRKHIDDMLYYSGPDPTSKHSYLNFCVVLLGEIDRLVAEREKQERTKMAADAVETAGRLGMGVPTSVVVAMMGIEPK